MREKAMYKSLKSQELRDSLSARGLDTSGTRPVLVARLEEDDDDMEEEKTIKKQNSASNEATPVSIAQLEEDVLEEKTIKKRISGANKAPHVLGGKKAKIPDQNLRTESFDDEESKEIDGFTVVELRSALLKRGLSTVGTKKALCKRLSEVLNDGKLLGADQVPPVHNGQKAEISEQDSEIKSLDNDEIKDIDGFTVVELRIALDKRALSTLGNKKTLYNRLLEDLIARKIAEEEDVLPVPNGKKAKISDQDSEAIDEIKAIDSFTVAELRAALNKRGLSMVGTKKTLYDRLSEDHNALQLIVTGEALPVPNGKIAKNSDQYSETKNTNNDEIKDIDRLTVAELREILNKQGLSTVGTKKTLHDRLSENLNAGKFIVADEVTPVHNGKKDKISDQDLAKKDSDTDEFKDVDRFTTEELRAALLKQGLSTVGTKKTLYYRLRANYNGGERLDKCKEDMIEHEDYKECDGTMHGMKYEKEKKIVTVTKKGRAVLDEHLPDDVKFRYHVLGKGMDIYDAMLNQTNVGGNNNKFYVIQALEPDCGTGGYLVYNRWGRVGVKGQNKLFACSSKAEAITEFESKFYDKTHNQWENRQNFNPVKNKYTWLERDYTDGSENSDSNIKNIEGKQKSVVKSPRESKLDSRLAQFISYICNIDMMRQQMLQIGYDATQLPLGKLSKSTILKGYECLKKIAAVLDKTTQGSIEQLSSDFYTVIPHDFGFQKMRSFIIDTPQKLKRKLEMVEALGEIQLATKLLKDVKEEDDPIYNHYKQLNCHLEPLQHDSEEFNWINEYLHNTHAKTHNQYELEIIEVFKAKRDIEQENFKRFTSVKNRMLLWHGSRLTNWIGILSQGLRIAPPEAPVTGYMFGKGVYFADMVSKSANYCYASHVDPVGVLLLCEVALGDMWELQTANYNANQLPPGKLSTKGVGGTEPNPKDIKILPGGVIVPMGKPVKKEGDIGSLLLYNEYIVYDVSQIQMRYVLQVKFKYHS